MNELKKPYPIAHRGCIYAGPENTLPAFEAAVASGIKGVEIDIRKTKDDEIIVFHDDEPERLLIGCESVHSYTKISDLTLEEIKQIKLPFAGHLVHYFPEGGYEAESNLYYYPWELVDHEELFAWYKKYDSTVHWMKMLHSYEDKFTKAFEADNRTAEILTFEEFLWWLKDQPADFFAEVEYKDCNMTPRIVEMMERTGTVSKCILFSGDRSYNDEMQEWFQKNGRPEGLRLGANIRYCTEEILDSIKNYSLYEVGLNAGHFGAEEVKRMNDRGIEVFSNLGDNPVWWETMEHIGVAGFKTNTVAAYLNWKKNNRTCYS